MNVAFALLSGRTCGSAIHGNSFPQRSTSTMALGMPLRAVCLFFLSQTKTGAKGHATTAFVCATGNLVPTFTPRGFGDEPSPVAPLQGPALQWDLSCALLGANRLASRLHSEMTAMILSKVIPLGKKLPVSGDCENQHIPYPVLWVLLTLQKV